MEYYSGNAIYELIKNQQLSNCIFTTGRMWFLVYADKSTEPLVLILLSEKSDDVEYKSNNLSTEENAFIPFAKEISRLTSVPLIYVCFNSKSKPISDVVVSSDFINFKKMGMEDYIHYINRFGPVFGTVATKKEINDKYSNVYQVWQNQHGGIATGSDIDLMITSKDGEIHTIFELKRSFFQLEDWKPYRQDFHNFEVIYNLLRSTNIHFYIMYNRRTKTPFFDDASKVRLFKIESSNPLRYTDKGTFDTLLLLRNPEKYNL